MVVYMAMNLGTKNRMLRAKTFSKAKIKDKLVARAIREGLFLLLACLLSRC